MGSIPSPLRPPRTIIRLPRTNKIYHRMGPRLPLSKIQLICDMLSSYEQPTISQIASMLNIVEKQFTISNQTSNSLVVPGPCQFMPADNISSHLQMLEALCDHPLEKPTLYLDKMAVFLLDKFNIHVIISTIGRALKSIGWSNKIAHQKAKGHNQDL